MSLVPTPVNCDPSVRIAIQKLASSKLGGKSLPTFAGLTLTGLTASTLIGANASKLLESVTIGTGLDYTRPTLSLSHLGIESLTDPGGDRILFWDDSETACKWLGVGNSIAITTTTLDTIQDIRTSASPTFANLSLGTGELTCGSINRATGTLTLEIGGTAEISITSSAATLGGNLVIPDNGTIGSVSDTDVMTIDASGNTTFSVFPITPSAAPDANYEVANKKYVDDNAEGTDEKCKVDSGATADYLGAASNDGILRSGTSMSYTDGGNYVTINTIQDIRTTDSPEWLALNITGAGSLPGTVTLGKIVRLTTDDNLYIGRTT